MPPAIIGGVIAGAGAVGAAAIGKSSANKAADTAAQAQQQASDQAAQVQREQMALQERLYNQGFNALQPYALQGQNIDDGTYLNALGLRGGDAAKNAFDAFRKSSGYDWKFNEGLRAIGGQYAGNGTFNSGARGKAFEAYGQGLADQTYNDWLSRIIGYNDNLRSLGFSAASAQAGVGQNYAGNMANSANALSNIYGARGDALANAALVKGQNNAQFANTLGGTLGGFAGSFLNPGSSNPFAATNALFNANMNGSQAWNRPSWQGGY